MSKSQSLRTLYDELDSTVVVSEDFKSRIKALAWQAYNDGIAVGRAQILESKTQQTKKRKD
jgi:hypothetical protein